MLLGFMHSVEKLQTAVEDPSSFLDSLATAGSPAAKRIAIATLKPKLKAELKERGLKWDDVEPALEEIDRYTGEAHMRTRSYQ